MAVERAGWREDIEGLRALAIVPVVLYHLDRSYAPGGFLGVDLFFVISGYLIGRMLLNESYLESPGGIGRFLRRRFLRIMPALAVTVALTSLIFAFFALPQYHAPFFLTGLSSLFGVSNMQLARLGTDYFAPAGGLNPFLHTWSVSIEDQFYTGFALLLAIANRLGGRRRIDAIVVTATIIAVECAVLYPPTPGSPAFFSLPLRAWEFLLGAVAFITQDALARRNRAWPDAIRWIGLLGIAWSLVRAREGSTLEPFLLCIGGAVLLIRTGPGTSGALSKALAHRALRAIGRRSFAIYLVHYPVLKLFELFADVGRSVPPLGVVYVMVTAFVAEMLHRGVERPYVEAYRHPDVSVRRRRPSGGFLWSSAVACALVAMLAMPYVSQARALRPRLAQEAARTHSAPGAPEVILLGDSHAQQFNATFNRLAQSDSIAVVDRTAIGCMASEELTYVRDGMPQGNCQNMVREIVADAASRPRSGRMVMIGIRTQMYLSPTPLARFDHPVDGLADSTRTYPLSDGKAVSLYMASLAQLVERLARAGVPVLFLAPLPEMRLPVYSCYLNPQREACQVPRAEEQEYRAAVMRGLHSLEAAHPSLEVWDVFDAVCPGSACGHFNGDTLVFVDDNHLSAEMAALLAPSLRQAIARTLAVTPRH